MSCFDVYRSQNGDIPFPKVLGTLADDASGESCILPRSLVKLYSDHANTSEFLSINDCKLTNANTRETTQLQQDIAGCRFNLSNVDQNQSRKALESLQTIYDKNIQDRIKELTEERDRWKAAYETTLSSFKTLESNLTSTLNTYYNAVTESNDLDREKKRLQAEEQRLIDVLANVKNQIQQRKSEAEQTVNNLRSTIDRADDYLSFVCVSQHCDYEGVQNTLRPGLYPSLPDVQGVSGFIIPPGMQVKIWEHQRYAGATATLDFTSDAKRCLSKLDKVVNFSKLIPSPSRRLGRRIARAKNENAFTTEKVKTIFSFNDNVKSAEVQKVASVGDFLDKWNGQI